MSGVGIGGHHNARARTDVWLTPPCLLKELGGAESFDLDPCASEDRPWDTAKRHLTRHDNGLISEWNGRVWLNPPYQTKQIRDWLARMSHHGVGTALIFARTETAHFARYVWETCDALLFLEGRINFHLPDGRRARKNAGAPSVLCAYGAADADVLAGCTLPGAFVPLRWRAFVFGFNKPGTWLEELKSWMERQSEPATLADLYRAFASSPKAARNPNYQAKIRQVLQRGPFQRVDRGVWRLEL